MNLVYSNYKKHNAKTKRLYNNAFSKKEKFPFWILKYTSKEKNALLNSILYNNDFVGIYYIVNCDNSTNKIM